MGVKYIGMDVHQAMIVIVVLNEAGKCVMQTMIETKSQIIVDWIGGLRGTVYVTFEEGTYAAWLYDLLSPHVEKVVVCDPRKNKLLPSGHKSDKVDARKLAEWLRNGQLVPVYHGSQSLRTLKELAHAYQCLGQDTTRVMNRLKALFRGCGIECGGRGIYQPRQRETWLKLLTQPGKRPRAELLYQQLDLLQPLRKAAHQAFLVESRRHAGYKILSQIPGLGPTRVAWLQASVETPHRFRSKRQFWSYVGLAVVTHVSGEYRMVDGQVRRSGKPVSTRGLNRNHNHVLKEVFKSATTGAIQRDPNFKLLYFRLTQQGMAPEMARLTLTRKLAAVTLALWKKGARYDPEQLKPQAA
ncbi:MAG: IS110 family transposase [Pyrinomonadaceae bacterium]